MMDVVIDGECRMEVVMDGECRKDGWLIMVGGWKD